MSKKTKRPAAPSRNTSAQSHNESTEKLYPDLSPLSDNASPSAVGDNRSPRGPGNSSYRKYRGSHSSNEESEGSEEGEMEGEQSPGCDSVDHMSSSQRDSSQSESLEMSYDRLYSKGSFQSSGSDRSVFSHSNSPPTPPLTLAAQSPLSRSSIHYRTTSNTSHRITPQRSRPPEATPQRSQPLQATPGPEPSIWQQFVLQVEHFCNTYLMQRSFAWLMLCVLIFAVILILMRPLLSARPPQLPTPPPTSPEQARDAMVARFESALATVRLAFPSQSHTAQKSMKAACKSALREVAPPKPGILVLAGNADAAQTIECLAKHMSRAAAEAYGFFTPQDCVVEVGATDYRAVTDPDELKLLLHSKLYGALAGQKRVAVVHQLELVHGRAAMLFHALCDNENAPFKDSVLVFTVHSNQSVTDEDQVETYLDAVWRDHMELDSRSPLLTRVVTFVAMVTPESRETLEQAGCVTQANQKVNKNAN